MSEIKEFICGICRKKGINFISTRKGLREHLGKEHIRSNFTNTPTIDGQKVCKRQWNPSEKTKQDWWITK